MLKKKFLSAFLYTCVFAFAITLSILIIPSRVHAADPTLSGWAWSSNIGWITFDTGATNAVKIANNGDMTGWAWSSNIGWIKFGGLNPTSFPAGGSNNNAKVNVNNGSVTGFARACAGTADGQCISMTSRTDGWDGWIELSGTNHATQVTSGTGGVTYIPSAGGGGAFKGYAWGGDVVGWIQFNPSVSGGVVVVSNNPASCTLLPNNNPVGVGQAFSLTWTTSNAPSTCTASGAWSGSKSTSGGSENMTINTVGDYTYNLDCDNAIPSSTNMCSTTVTVQQNAVTNTLPLWLNGTQSQTSMKIRPGKNAKLNWKASGNISNFQQGSCVGYAYNAADNSITINGWNDDDTTLPDDQDTTPLSVRLDNAGEYKFQIQCDRLDNTNDLISVMSNFVNVKVVEASIEER